MTITQVGKFYPPHRGGIETHLEALCHELRQRVDLSVLVANDGSTTVESIQEGVRVTRLSTSFRFSSAPVCPALVGRLRSDKSDIVHIHLPNPTAILAYLASGHRGRLVLTYHSDVLRQKHLDQAFRPILLSAMNRCSAVICSSPNYIDASPVLSRFRHLCRVIPLGISCEPFDHFDQETVDGIRGRYGAPMILTVGRLVSYKGIEYLIRAMSTVNAKLLIIGSGPLRRNFERLIQELNLQSRVELVGEVENLVPYYHAADIFVLPSIARTEAFGIVQLEAMACRKPVINTQIDSGVPFVSPNDVTGLTVKPSDHIALSRALQRLLSDSELRTRFGQAGRARVEQEFSLEIMTQRTMELYSDVLAQPRALPATTTGAKIKALAGAVLSRAAAQSRSV